MIGRVGCSDVGFFSTDLAVYRTWWTMVRKAALMDQFCPPGIGKWMFEFFLVRPTEVDLRMRLRGGPLLELIGVRNLDSASASQS